DGNFSFGYWQLFLDVACCRRGTIHRHKVTNSTYCVYRSDVATGYGVGAFLFLLSGESLLMGVTKCMCLGRPLAPGGNRAWTIIYFTSSWSSFFGSRSLSNCRGKEECLPYEIQRV
ncbi:Protein of unknown function DUF1218, partial [Cynara cardunculus var. scolymus]